MANEASVVGVLAFFERASVEDAEQVLRVAEIIVRDKLQSRPAAQGAHTPGLLPLPDSRQRPSTSGSVSVRAEQVLRDAGSPMHSDELTAAINSRYQSDHTKATVVGAVSRMVKNRDTFVRVGHGQYGLIEWQAGSLRDQGSDPAQGGTL